MNTTNPGGTSLLNNQRAAHLIFEYGKLGMKPSGEWVLIIRPDTSINITRLIFMEMTWGGVVRKDPSDKPVYICQGPWLFGLLTDLKDHLDPSLLTDCKQALDELIKGKYRHICKRMD